MSAISNFFADRNVQYPGRVTLTIPGDEEGTTYDVTRSEGTITTAGTPFKADTFNRIADEIMDVGQENADLVAKMLTSTLTANSTYFSDGTIKYGQIGNMVIVYVFGTTSASLPANNTRVISTGNMTSGLRPSAITRGSIRSTDAGLLQVTSGGTVGVVTGADAILSGTQIAGEVCFYL